MKPVFSLLHATYGRPEKAIAAMKMANERASQPGRVEHIFACNADDPTLVDFQMGLAAQAPLNGTSPFVVIGNFNGSAPAWNAAANQSVGEVLIQMQDDLELPDHWDSVLMKAILANREACLALMVSPVFVRVSDGYRNDGICCTAIMNRARYLQQGEFLHPGYISVFSDDDVTYRALRDARDGKCVFVDAREIIFLHRHHYHDKTVPMDATYERENSSEAYAVGSELFHKRNPQASTDGLRTWH